MSRPYRDKYEHERGMYNREPFHRDYDTPHQAFYDTQDTRDRSYQDVHSGYPYGPEDHFYHSVERDCGEQISHSSRFTDPVVTPLMPPREHSLPIDPLPVGGHPLSLDLLSQREFSGSEQRFGSPIILPPHLGDIPTKPKTVFTEAPSNTLYVGGIPTNTTERHLEDVFRKYGKVMSVRIRHSFAHIQFKSENMDHLVGALELDGHYIRVGPATSAGNFGKLQVEFAVRREARALANELVTAAEVQLLSYNSTNVSSLANDLHKEEKFMLAARNVKTWLEQGNCTSVTSNLFFGLVSSVNTCSRRLKRKVKEKTVELQDILKRHKEGIVKLDQECKAVLGVFQAASVQKARDNFTKPQRKSLAQWIDTAYEIQEEINREASNTVFDYVEGPPTKTRKIDANTGASVELEVLKKEFEQLRKRREAEVQERDEQILLLKSLVDKFKESCPTEWETLEAETGLKADDKTTVIDNTDKIAETDSQVPPKAEVESTPSPSGLEIIEEFNDDDSKQMDIEELEEEGNSLAAAAAAYAQLRSTIRPTTTEGMGLSEPEVAIVSVLGSFLTVHPLGATINEITTYFQGFNPAYNAHYLESLLRRLSKVFQLSSGGDGLSKWWFMGFQTCYAAVGEKQTDTSAISREQEKIEPQQEEQAD